MDGVYGSVPIQHLVGLLALLRTRFDTTYDRAQDHTFLLRRHQVRGQVSETP